MIDTYNSNHEKRSNVFWTSLIAQRIYIIFIVSIITQQLWLLHMISYILLQQTKNILYLWYRYHIEIPDNQIPFRILQYYKQKLFYNSIKYIFGGKSNNNNNNNETIDTLNMMSVLQDMHHMKRYGRVSYIYYVIKYQTRLLRQQHQLNYYERHGQVLLLQENILQYEYYTKTRTLPSTANNLFYIFPTNNRTKQQTTKLPSLIIPTKTPSSTTSTSPTKQPTSTKSTRTTITTSTTPTKQ